ncbi:MAG: hypothetical protein LBJ74_03610 [Heliobacteriaceae bacterium]|jgi:hypothetical protein|nr:hypothetical protein [Heliobacteriaceae bacterium]
MRIQNIHPVNFTKRYPAIRIEKTADCCTKEILKIVKGTPAEKELKAVSEIITETAQKQGVDAHLSFFKDYNRFNGQNFIELRYVQGSTKVESSHASIHYNPSDTIPYDIAKAAIEHFRNVKRSADFH